MRDIGVDQVVDAMGEFYAAAYGEVSWAAAVETLRRLFRGSTVGFERHDPHIGDGDDIATEMVPAGPRLFCRIWGSESAAWTFNVRRERSQEQFGQDEIALLRRLLPHLRRAVAIARDRQIAQALIGAHAQLPFGILLLTLEHRVVAANDQARRLLAQPGASLHIEAERLVSAPYYASAVRRLIEGACRDPTESPPCLLLRRSAPPRESQDIMLSILPASGGPADGVAWDPCVAVLLREVSPHLPENFDAHLRTAFNLTPAEARLAATLCAGQPLKAAAALQDIRFSTARHYLEKIFQKTGTSQQSQLVALLMSIQPLLWG